MSIRGWKKFNEFVSNASIVFFTLLILLISYYSFGFKGWSYTFTHLKEVFITLSLLSPYIVLVILSIFTIKKKRWSFFAEIIISIIFLAMISQATFIGTINGNFNPIATLIIIFYILILINSYHWIRNPSKE